LFPPASSATPARPRAPRTAWRCPSTDGRRHRPAGRTQAARPAVRSHSRGPGRAAPDWYAVPARVPVVSACSRPSQVVSLRGAFDARMRSDGGADESAGHVGAQDRAVGIAHQPLDARAVAGIETETVAAFVAFDVQREQVRLAGRLRRHDFDLALA